MSRNRISADGLNELTLCNDSKKRFVGKHDYNTCKRTGYRKNSFYIHLTGSNTKVIKYSDAVSMLHA